MLVEVPGTSLIPAQLPTAPLFGHTVANPAPALKRATSEAVALLRADVGVVEKPDGLVLTNVQDEVRHWIVDSGLLRDAPNFYTRFDRAHVDGVFARLHRHLRDTHASLVSDVELRSSELFIRHAFETFYDQPAERAQNSAGVFAFVVPVRMGKRHVEYGEECEYHFPSLRYVPNELRAQFIAGIPPFIIDRYLSVGREAAVLGYCVWGGVSDDLAELGRSAAIKAVRKNVTAAVEFCRDQLGAGVVGLGATLPSTTNYGRALNVEGVVLTTGHSGTTRLIEDTIAAAIKRGYITRENPSIGVLGQGSIGAVAAAQLALRFPASNQLLFDANRHRSAQVAAVLCSRGSDVEVSPTTSALIAGSDVLVAAITETVNLSQLGINDMSATFCIDDSEPRAVNTAELERMGGRGTKVIATSESALVPSREGYDFGTMLDPGRDFFGCEAESMCLALYYRDLLDRGLSHRVARRIVEKIATTRPVDRRSVRLVGALFLKFQIVPSRFQAFRTATPPPVGYEANRRPQPVRATRRDEPLAADSSRVTTTARGIASGADPWPDGGVQ